jgi:hypothetical protein
MKFPSSCPAQVPCIESLISVQWKFQTGLSILSAALLSMVRNDFFDPTRDEKLRTRCASGSRLRSLLPYELRKQIINVVHSLACHDAACSTSCLIAQLRDTCCPCRQGGLSSKMIDFHRRSPSAPQGAANRTRPPFALWTASTHLVRR